MFRKLGVVLLVFCAVFSLSILSVSCSNSLVPPADDPAASADSADAASSRALGSRIRLVAANLSSGTRQSYDLGHGQRILKGLKPDVVMIQEFNYKTNASSSIQAFANDVIGSTAYWFRESGSGDTLPNGIISRYPIKSSGEWDDVSMGNRDFAWACIDVPGTVDLWVVSVHIKASSGSSSTRNAEAKALVSLIKSKVPAQAYLAIGGDFNTSSRSEACLKTLGQVVLTSGPFPVCQGNDPDTNKNRNSPYDAVYADSDLEAKAVPTVVGSHSFANGLVVDTRVTSPYSIVPDIFPALSGDSADAYMQHMAIVRDFSIPQ